MNRQTLLNEPAEMLKIEKSVPGNCSFSCPVSIAQTLELQQVLDQFEREAKWSVVKCNYDMPFYSWGEGPPLIFIPGLCDDARSFVMPSAVLSKRFRCISYSLPTARGDNAQLNRYKHTDFVDDLLALTKHLKLEQVFLFGSSFGSTIGMSAMHRDPNRFPKAVVQGGFARRELARSEVWLARMARYFPWPLRYLPGREKILTAAHLDHFENRSEDVWRYYLERNGDPPMKAVSHRALLLNSVDLRPILSDIPQPVLMICGDQDPLVNKECERVLLDGLPNATRAEISGCGHMPQFTHPELLAELIERYLLLPGEFSAAV